MGGIIAVLAVPAALAAWLGMSYWTGLFGSVGVPYWLLSIDQFFLLSRGVHVIERLLAETTFCGLPAWLWFLPIALFAAIGTCRLLWELVVGTVLVAFAKIHLFYELLSGPRSYEEYFDPRYMPSNSERASMSRGELFQAHDAFMLRRRETLRRSVGAALTPVTVIGLSCYFLFVASTFAYELGIREAAELIDSTSTHVSVQVKDGPTERTITGAVLACSDSMCLVANKNERALVSGLSAPMLGGAPKKPLESVATWQ